MRVTVIVADPVIASLMLLAAELSAEAIASAAEACACEMALDAEARTSARALEADSERESIDVRMWPNDAPSSWDMDEALASAEAKALWRTSMASKGFMRR